jgi:hypothetical protein
MSTQGIQTTSHSPLTYFLERTSTISTLPDGLNHTLNQENIRLQQIVYEHKVRIEPEPSKYPKSGNFFVCLSE